MHSRWAMGLAVSAVLLAVPVGVALAGKPGGGGGSTPAGTIYFKANGTPWSLRSMNADGSGKTFLRSMPGGNAQPVRASRMLHGGKRWFLIVLDVPGESGPGLHPTRCDLFAVCEDGAPPVRLTSDPTMDYFGAQIWDWCPDEAPDGATISGIARRWAGSGVISGSAGVYTASLSFDASGNLLGLVAEPSFRVSVGTFLDRDGNQVADATNVSWSPDMSRLVCDRASRPEVQKTYLRVVDAATGTATLIYPLDAGRLVELPDWAPDGSRIAYHRTDATYTDGSLSAIETVLPDGTGHQVVAAGSRRLLWLQSARYSPDSAWIVFCATSLDKATRSDDVWRVGASGGTAVNLTADLTAYATPVDWR